MKTYKPDDLFKENPELFKEIRKGIDVVIPEIYDHVATTLDGQPSDTIAEHCTFFRIEGEDKKMVFVEISLLFKMIFKFMFSMIKEIRIHDTFEDYEAARRKIVEESEKKFGGSLGVSQYGGMKINLN